MLEGGDLASIHSKEENDFIQTLQKENLVWFGGRIAEKDGEFSWIDGSEWNYDSWDESEQKLSNCSSVKHFLFRGARQEELWKRSP